MKIYAFDFDGTLTRRDTFIEFIRYVFGARRKLAGIDATTALPSSAVPSTRATR